MNKKLENKKHGVVNTTIAGNASETIQNYGSAISHHTAAYKGNMTVDGVHVGKGLKDIANSKVHPDYEQTNIKQQAVFVAENKEVARRNADLAMEGKKPNVSRTADAGMVNDQLSDIISIDCYGNPISDTGIQMKFVGDTPKAAIGKCLSQKYDKYLDTNTPIMVPNDYYDGMHNELSVQIDDLNKQIDYANKTGNTDLLKQQQTELTKVKNLKSSLKKSNVSNKEAIEARTECRSSTNL